MATQLGGAPLREILNNFRNKYENAPQIANIINNRHIDQQLKIRSTKSSIKKQVRSFIGIDKVCFAIFIMTK